MNKALRFGGGIGLLAALIVGVISLAEPSLFGLEWLVYDAFSRKLAPGNPPDPRIIIVAVNEKSLQTLEPEYGRWPSHSRLLMSMALDEISRSGAKLAVFDFLFAGRTMTDEEDDRAFITSLTSFPSVLGAQTELRPAKPVAPEFSPWLWKLQGANLTRPFQLVTPLELFNPVAGIGTIRLNVDSRQYILADPLSRSSAIPGLAVAGATAYLALPREISLSSDGDRASIGKLRVPATTAHIRDAAGNSYGTPAFFIRWTARKSESGGRLRTYQYIDFDKLVVASLARQDPEVGISPEELEKFSDMFKDKIVLLGATGAGLFDLRSTPLSPSAPGVEIHATALDNLINGEFNQLVSRNVGLGIMLVLSALFGWAVFAIRSQPLAGALFTVVLLGLIGGEFLLLRNGLIFFSMGPAIAMLVTYIAVTLVKFVAEQRQSVQLKATFGRYVSPQILDHILAHPEKVELGGERRDLTILFSDIRGFTTISEASEPEEVVEMLNEYLTRMVEILLRHGGTLDKFIGDAVMGFWNAPTLDPDHPRRAVECAIEMIQETTRLREAWEPDGKAAIRIGIGINTGEAVVGNIGSRQVFGYTVIGDAVNLASRLESKNKDYGTEIIISEFTRARIGDSIPSTYLDDVKVKGKDKAVKIYEVKGLSA